MLLVALYNNLGSHDSAYSAASILHSRVPQPPMDIDYAKSHPNENPHTHPVRPIYVEPADWIAAVRQSWRCSPIA